MKKIFKLGNDLHEFQIERGSEELTLKNGESSLTVAVNQRPPAEFVLDINGELKKVYGIKVKDDIFVQAAGRTWQFKDVTNDADEAGGADSSAELKIITPMPGSVIKVLVAAGDKVQQNQPLVIVEAMKMENEVKAAMDAVVADVLVEAGQQVGANELLIELALPE